MNTNNKEIPRYVGTAELCLLIGIIIFAILECPDLPTLARQLLDHNDVREAQAVVDKIHVSPEDTHGSARLALLKADLAIAQADPKAALEQSDAAAKFTPKSVPTLVRRSEILDMFCKPKEAMAVLVQLDQLRQDVRKEVEAEGLKAIVDQLPETFQLQRGELPTVELLLKSFEQWMLPYRLRLASYARWFQDLDLGIKTLTSIFAEHPDDVRSGIALAHLLSYKGDHNGATAILEKIAKSNPELAGIQRQLSLRFRRRGDPEKAAAALIAAGLDKATIRTEIIQAYVEAGRADEAIPAVLKYLPGEQDTIYLRLLLVRHLVEVGDLRKALAVTSASMQQFGEDKDLLRWAAELLARLGDHKNAAAAYLKLRLVDPRDTDLALHTMWELQASGQGAAALAQLEDLARMDPGNPRWSRDLGIQYAQMGKFQQAQPLLEKAMALDPDDDEVIFQLAQVLGKIGDPSKSAELYRRLLEVRTKQTAAATASVTPVTPLVPTPEKPIQYRRRVLALYKRSERQTPDKNSIHSSLELPLNHLGLAVDYRAVEEAWPSDTDMTNYRAVIMWFNTEEVQDPEHFIRWLEHQSLSGIKLIFMNQPGCTVDARSGHTVADLALKRLEAILGLHFGGSWTDDPSLIDVENIDPQMCEFERALAYEKDYFREVKCTDPTAKVYLKLRRKDKPKDSCDAVVTGKRASFCLTGYSTYIEEGGWLKQWRLNPFRFLTEALELDNMPRLDFTTANGRRILLCQVDGDGARLPNPWNPGRYNDGVFLRDFLPQHPFPYNISFIAGVFERERPEAGETFDEERTLVRQPGIELGHHTYSNPMDWTKPEPGMFLPGYDKVDLEQEVVRAAHMLERAICPEHQRVQLISWTGDLNPDEKALAMAEAAGMSNFNGGHPFLDGNHPSILGLEAPLKLVGGHYQFMSAAASDYDHTDRWTLPSVVYQNLLETFAATGAPRRILPVDFHFHFFTLSTEAGMKSLSVIADDLAHKELHPRLLSEYIPIVTGFQTARIDQVGASAWKVSGYGECRTIRFDGIPEGADASQSQGVVGWRRDNGSLYVHLDRGDAAIVVLSAGGQRVAHLESSAAPVEEWTMAENRLTFKTHGTGKVHYVIGDLEPEHRFRVQPAHAAMAGSRQTAVLTTDAGGRLSFDLDLAGPAEVVVSPDGGSN